MPALPNPDPSRREIQPAIESSPPSTDTDRAAHPTGAEGDLTLITDFEANAIRDFNPTIHNFEIVKLEVEDGDGFIDGLDEKKVDELLGVLMNPQSIGSSNLKHISPNEAASCVWLLRALENNQWLRNHCASEMSWRLGSPADMHQNSTPKAIAALAENLRLTGALFRPENRPTEVGEYSSWLQAVATAV